MRFSDCQKESNEIGTVVSTSMPLVYVEGLPNVRYGEIVVFEDDTLGQIYSVKKDLIEIVYLSNTIAAPGTKVVRTLDQLKLPVSEKLLGHVIDPFCKSLYDKKIDVSSEKLRYVHQKAPGISSREKITEPFLTGISIVDLMMPLGKGQRELLIGDRKTGKTAFALQTILYQASQGVKCVYASIGKRKGSIKSVENFLIEHDVLKNSVLVASTDQDSLGAIYLTPYVAMTIAEEFRNNGEDVLLILDDISTHAKFYREVSLLSEKFPGREAYPGDIFYTHSKLIERAGSFKKGTITCLPIVNTVENDISGFIQTNLMSMTDGHLFFDKEYFYKGQRPAVNTFLSVTRVGRQTQTPLRWSISRELSSFFTLYRKTENFVHFGAELSEGIRSTLSIGEKINHFFKQAPSESLTLDEQISMFCAIWSNIWLNKTVGDFNILLNSTLEKYRNDESFRNTMLKMIEESDSFNMLLGKFMREIVSKKVIS